MAKLSPTTRIFALVIKEILTLFKDPKGRIVLIAPPLLQLLIFSFAATMEIKNISIGILNQDSGKHGYEVIQRFIGSPTFSKVFFIQKQSDIKPIIDNQEAMVVMTIPQDFSRKIESHSQANIQLILDGRRSNATQIVNGYISSIIENYDQEIQKTSGSIMTPPVMVTRSWFNENLLYLWFTVPSLICILSMLISLVVTALSVARERELGTFDQLLVSPLTPYEILIGKTIPAIIIGLAEGFLMWIAAVWLFDVPFYGSSLLMIYVLFIFIMSTVGVGLFISSMCKTQQQAILGVFIYMVPVVTLSGYASPVENMPEWLQDLTWFNPLKFTLIAVIGIFLKGMSALEVFITTWPLLLVGAVTLFIAGWFFKQRME
ncbi:TPA: ABC transporter permease [Legionella pneumophila]|uniref:ABC transporter permease n=1 Tax=Legionella pneumophila TaxID=446 RepID=A0AAN5P5Q0_LEGPN|nr:ABC transporter permease [Legionella pneumophila]HAT1595409.1 ABC transporter permease [Legionella pneumophila]HAT1970460.1 ABC transporter permease [Legionella pneumophila]HAT3975298.1 ABC transporter permease [Legionella pneumophila]HAT6956168.1 ABC transporter permease [Legionella pneumophila]HAT6978309.1 ABC transporter permease [Legionella pneumophila]